MKNFKTVAILFSVLFVGNTAHALVSGELLLGRRWAETKTSIDTYGYQLQEITAAVHLDPIPLVPVSFGVAYSNFSALNKNDWRPDASVQDRAEIGIEAKAWFPLIPAIDPYVRGRYVVHSAPFWVKTTGYEAQLQTSGSYLNLGIRWSVVPLVGLKFEVSQGFQMIKAKKIKVNGQDVDDMPGDDDFNSRAILIGADVSI